MRRLLLVLLALLLLCSAALAHSGRTDSRGGHWDHSTGEYHYHNDGSYQGGSSSGSSSSSGYSSGKPSKLVTTENVNMREGPGTSYDIITTLSEGVTLSYGGKISGNWYYVKYGLQYGWINQNYARVTAWESSGGSSDEYKPILSTILDNLKSSSSKTAASKIQKKGYEPSLKTLIIVFCAGLAVGLVILFIYSRKVAERESIMRTTAVRNSESSYRLGRESAENNLVCREKALQEKQAQHIQRVKEDNEKLDRRKELFRREVDLYKKSFAAREEKFKKEIEQIRRELFPLEACAPVTICDDLPQRGLYHTTDSTCIAYSKTVALLTAQELGLRPCPKCKPNEKLYTTQLKMVERHYNQRIPLPSELIE